MICTECQWTHDHVHYTRPTDCTCRDVLVDWRQRTIGHPYTLCPHHDTVTTFGPSRHADEGSS